MLVDKNILYIVIEDSYIFIYRKNKRRKFNVPKGGIVVLDERNSKITKYKVNQNG